MIHFIRYETRIDTLEYIKAIAIIDGKSQPLRTITYHYHNPSTITNKYTIIIVTQSSINVV